MIICNHIHEKGNEKCIFETLYNEIKCVLSINESNFKEKWNKLGEICDLQAKLGLWDHFRTLVLVGTKTQISASKYQIFRQTLLKECGTWEHWCLGLPQNLCDTRNSGFT